MKSVDLLHILILLLGAHLCTGQSNPYYHFSVPEGLPSQEVYDVHQDGKGFIWFATDNGVVRFDGKDMDLFQNNEGLTDPVVFEFVEDAKERLWFRTLSGRISYFQNEKVHKYPHSDSIAAYCRNSYLQSLYIDKKDQVWFGSGVSLGRIDSKGVITKEKRNGPYEGSFRTVENQLLHSHKEAIFTRAVVNGRKTTIYPNDSATYHFIICPIKWRGQQYFSHGHTIYKIGKDTIQPVFTGRTQIIRLSLDFDDNLWVCYDKKGVDCLVDFKTTKPVHFDFINSKSVTKVLQDRKGGYWLSTLQDGVYYVRDNKLFVQPLPANSKVNAVISLGNKILVGDATGQVSILDENTKEIADTRLDGSVLSILKVNEMLWVSTQSATYLLSQSFQKKRSSLGSYSGMFYAPDHTIWAVSGEHRSHFNEEGKLLGNITDHKTNRLILMNSNFTFLFGRLGLQVFKDENEIKLPAFFDAIKVTKVLPVNDSTLLMGTLGNGFLLVNPFHWTYKQYSSRQKFTASNVYDILKEGSNIWMGTEKGIAIAPIESIINDNPRFSFFVTQNVRVNEKINYVAKVGENILAFSDQSLYTFPKTMASSLLPEFYVQNILLNNQLDSIRSDQEVEYDHNNIQVNFRFIDFANQNVFVRSRLSPESPWTYSQERNIKIYSLRSGIHRLEIQYSIDNLHWSSGLIWNFTILPPWWRIWYLQAGFTLLFAAAILLYFRRRVARVNERNNYLNLINSQQQMLIKAELEAQERERTRIAKDLHDSVGTNLTAIKMTVRGLLKKYQEPKAEAIETEFQNTIQEIKSIIHELVPAGLDKYGLSVTVRTYASKIEENLNMKIEVNSFGEDCKDPKVNLLAFRILQELLSNTLKHAEASRVMIHINSFDDMISILYQDNGKGFDIETAKRGSGLVNVESRVQAASGNLKFESGEFGVSYTIDLPLKPNGKG